MGAHLLDALCIVGASVIYDFRDLETLCEGFCGSTGGECMRGGGVGLGVRLYRRHD